jgi:hypothetical protein
MIDRFELKTIESEIEKLLSFNCLKPIQGNQDRRIYPKSVHFKYGMFWLFAIEEGQELDFLLSNIFSSWEGIE